MATVPALAVMTAVTTDGVGGGWVEAVPIVATLALLGMALVMAAARLRQGRRLGRPGVAPLADRLA